MARTARIPRRSLFVLAALAVVLIAAVTPWALPSGRLDRQVSREIADAFGLTAELSGRTTFAMLPTPRVKFGAIRLVNADGLEILRAAQFRGELRLAALLFGRLELSEISFSDGRLTVDWDRDRSPLWNDAMRHLALRLGAASSGGPAVRRLILANMSVVATDRRSGRVSELSSANLLAQMPGRQSDFGLAGSATWAGHSFDFALSDIEPAALAGGRSSPVSARLNGDLINAALSGSLTWTDGPRIVGALTTDVPSLQNLSAWQGYGPIGTKRSLSASGDLDASAQAIDVTRLRAVVGPDTIDGAVSLHTEGDRPVVRATLAADSFDLSPYVDRSPDRRSGMRTIGPRDLTAIDLDLRLSALGMNFGRGLRMADVAASVLTTSDRIDFSLGRATLAGGTIKGRLSLEQEENGWELRSQASFSRIDLAKTLLPWTNARLLSGAAGGQIALEASSPSLDGLMPALEGQGTITIDNGVLTGVTLPDPTRPDVGRALVGGGRTAFHRLQASGRLASGRAEFSQIDLDTGILKAEANGTVTFPDGVLALTLRMRGGSEPGGGSAGLAVTGTWGEPLVAAEPVNARTTSH